MIKKIILGILNFAFRFSVLALVVVCVYRLAMYSYHFGYMVFSDTPKEPEPGRDIVVTIENTDNILELGRFLRARGVIGDEKIFLVQERLSDYHGKLVPGNYTLNTSMAPSTIFETLGAAYTSEDEEGEEGDGKDKPASDSAAPGGDVMYDPLTGEVLEKSENGEVTVQSADEGEEAPEGDIEEGEGGSDEDAQSESEEKKSEEKKPEETKPEEKKTEEKKSDPFKAGAGW